MATNACLPSPANLPIRLETLLWRVAIKRLFSKIGLRSFIYICFAVVVCLSISNVTNDGPSSRAESERNQAPTVERSKRTRRAASEERIATQNALVPVTNGNETVIDRGLFRYMAAHLANTSYAGVDYYIKYTAARLGSAPLASVEPMVPDLGPVVNDVTYFEYPIDIGPCRNSTTAGRSLFIAVISAPGYFHKREVFRRTWMNHLRNHSDLIGLAGFGFVVGVKDGDDDVQKRLEQESALHNDIIQVGMMDSYYNITLKVAGLFNWLNNHCRQVDFVLKVDDDVYVNVRNLATVLQTLSPSNTFAYGVQMPYLDPERNQADKWSISYERWPWSTFPDFLRGASVLMAGRAIRLLLAGFQTTPFIPFDDVYLTGLAASKANVSIYTNDGMFNVRPMFPLHSCMARNTITWLTSSSAEMKASHTVTEQFYNGDRPCLIPADEKTHRIPPLALSSTISSSKGKVLQIGQPTEQQSSMEEQHTIEADPRELIEFPFELVRPLFP